MGGHQFLCIILYLATGGGEYSQGEPHTLTRCGNFHTSPSLTSFLNKVNIRNIKHFSGRIFWIFCPEYSQRVTILRSLKGIMCNLCLSKIVTNYVKASKEITVLFFLFKALLQYTSKSKENYDSFIHETAEVRADSYLRVYVVFGHVLKKISIFFGINLYW